MNYHEAIEYLDLRADERGAVALSVIELAVVDLRAALEETLENLCHCCRLLNPQHANCTWCPDTEQARAILGTLEEKDA